MVKQLGQKMAEFGFRYEDYRRREWFKTLKIRLSWS
jgi:hypothetical protein